MSTYRKVNMKEPPAKFENCPGFLDCYLKYLSDFEHKRPPTVIETFTNLREMLQYFHFIARFQSRPSTGDAHKDLDITLMPISELEPLSADSIASYLDFLEFKVGNATSTVNKKLSVFRAFFIYLERNAGDLGLSDHYRAPTSTIRFRKRTPPKSKVITTKKVQALAKACSGDSELRDRAIILLLSAVPLQISDLVRLDRSDFSGSQLRVQFPNKAPRNIPLPEHCSDAISDYLDWLDEKLDDADVDPPAALFVSKKGTRFNRVTPRTIQNHISKAAAAAGLASEEITASKLRESAIQKLLNSLGQRGGDDKEIIQLLDYLGYDDPAQKARRHNQNLKAARSGEDLFLTAVANSDLSDVG